MKGIVVLISVFAFSAEAVNLDVRFEGLSSDKGRILYLLFDQGEGFPDNPGKSVRQGSLKASEASGGLRLSELKGGIYALSVIHDENENDKLDTNFLGIPKEDFGFSNNPKVFFGPPGFNRASFDLFQDREVVIEMKGI